MGKQFRILVVMVISGGVMVYDVFDDTNEGVAVADRQQKNINTEGKNMPEIIVDITQDIPEPSAVEQGNEEIQDDNEEVIAELEILDEQEIKDVDLSDLPTEMNLAVPFFAQAPDGNRSLPRKEACEEASLVLAAYYLNGKTLTKTQFKEDIFALVNLQKDLFGDYVDTDVEQTAKLFEVFYGIGTTKIIDNPTIEQMKAELVQGHPVVAPFAGKKLGNSHFTNGGPRYHMLVIRGYDATYFYTNDVGTKYGENFPYTHATIMDALHDLVRVGEGEITEGVKRILVLRL